MAHELFAVNKSGLLPCTFFSLSTFPQHKTYMNQLKKATSILKELRDHEIHDRERDLAEKRAAFGQTLPDIRTWEEYISNPDHLNKFHEQLGVMENA